MDLDPLKFINMFCTNNNYVVISDENIIYWTKKIQFNYVIINYAVIYTLCQNIWKILLKYKKINYNDHE